MASTSTEKTIWNYLYDKIKNAFGTAGAMGNLYAESGLVPNNLQNSYNTKLKMTDEEYTAAVDDGSYTNFASDSAGYGLAQWTYGSRKKNLKAHADKKGTSIGDQTMQLEFFIKELQESYASVWETLTNATSVKEASDAMLTGYEKPANQSDSVKTKRAGYGQTYYDTYAGTEKKKSKPTYKVGETYTLQTEVNVRKGAGTGYAKVGYNGLTADGKKHDKDKDGALDAGTEVTCQQIKEDGDDIWIQCPSGWLAAYFDGDIYIK